MIRPSNAPIQIIRRSDWDEVIRVYSHLGATDPMDLTGNTFMAQLWDRPRSIKYMDITVNQLDLNIGIIKLSLTSDQTANLPTIGTYDVKMYTPLGLEYYLVSGTFTTSQGYTDD